MFKFNFDTENENNPSETEVDEKAVIWQESKVVTPLDDDLIIKDIFTNCTENTIDYGDITVRYFATTDILNILKTSDDILFLKELSVIKADEEHSDLQTAIYEGGLKIWECTYDLLNYIFENNLNFKNKRVLDLGCGAGLVGILSLLKGAQCTFQDYNADVLQYITIPNVMLNDDDKLKESEYYSGDWSSFINTINIQEEDKKFDYIFTSETIYNIENYEKLTTIFQSLLKRSGKIFLAAKSYYFGIGGGIAQFQKFLDNKGSLKSEVCWKCSEGLSREIIQIRFT